MTTRIATNPAAFRPLLDQIGERWGRLPTLLDARDVAAVMGHLTADYVESHLAAGVDPNVRVSRSDGAAVFIERADRIDGVLDGLCTQLSDTLGVPVHADVILAEGQGTLGCHFDDSENISVQVRGEKRWVVAPAATLPDEWRQQRSYASSDIGNCFVPSTAEELTLVPGQGIYLPYLGPHLGTSDGPSLSVSFVAKHVTPRPRRRTVNREDAVDGVHRLVRRARDARSDETIDVNTAALEVATVAGCSSVDAALGDRNLRRVAGILARWVAETTSPVALRHLQHAAHLLLALPDPALRGLLTEPHVTSWILELSRLGRNGWVAEQVVPYLTLAAVDAAISAEVGVDQVDVARSAPGLVRMHRSGVTVAVPHDAAEIRISSDGNMIDANWRGAGGTSVVARAGHVSGAFITTGVDEWLACCIQARALQQPRPQDAQRVVTALAASVSALPPGIQLSQLGVRWVHVAPGVEASGAPTSGVRAFRNLILVSSDIGQEPLLQRVLHEAGHQRMSSFSELFELAPNPDVIERFQFVNARLQELWLVKRLDGEADHLLESVLKTCASLVARDDISEAGRTYLHVATEQATTVQ